ncbi:MAG: hypothetical protein Q8P67_28020, partial [archaeon]|nr:hypothetical protein [archaeon]
EDPLSDALKDPLAEDDPLKDAPPFPGIRLHVATSSPAASPSSNQEQDGQKQITQKLQQNHSPPVTSSVAPPRRLRKRDGKHDPFLSLFETMESPSSGGGSLFDSAKKTASSRAKSRVMTGSLPRPLQGFKSSLFEEDDDAADDSFLSERPDSLIKMEPTSSTWLFSDPFKLFPSNESLPSTDPQPPAVQDPAELNRLLETIPGLSKVLNGYHSFAGKVSVRQLSFELIPAPFSEDRLSLVGDLNLISGSPIQEELTSPRSVPRSVSSPRRDPNSVSPTDPPSVLLKRGSFVDAFRRNATKRPTSVSSASNLLHSSGGSLPEPQEPVLPPSVSADRVLATVHPQKWLLIFNDLLLVASLDLGVEHQFPLKTVWVESLDAPEHAEYHNSGIVIRTPECLLTVYASLASKRSYCASLLMRLIKQELESDQSYLGLNRRLLANYSYKQGYMFSGEWLSGKPHGHGTMLSLDGTKYDGEWSNGKKHGHGFMLSRSSQTYEGEWKEDMRDGHGKLTLPEDNPHQLVSYEGSWRKNRRHGPGTLVYNNLDSVHCEFSENRPVNPIYWTSSSKTRYIGFWNFERRVRQGFGISIYPSGERYYGLWLNDMRENMGVLISPTGTHYFGGWAKDQQIGKCRIRFPNGDMLAASSCQGDWHDSLELGHSVFQIAEIPRLLPYPKSKPPPARLASASQLGEKWLALYRWKLIKPKRSTSDPAFSELAAEDPNSTAIKNSYHTRLRELIEKGMMAQLPEFLSEMFASIDHPLGVVTRTFVHYFKSMYEVIFDSVAHSIPQSKYDSALEDLQSFLGRFPSEFALNFLRIPEIEPQHITTAVHSVIFPAIHACLFPQFVRKNSIPDQLFHAKAAKVRKLPPDEMFEVIGIEGQVAQCVLNEFKRLKSDPKLPSDLYPFLDAIDTLADFGEYFTPHEKLGVLEQTARHIEEYLKRFIGAFGADEFLPVFTFVLIQADIPSLHAHTSFIDAFMDPDLKCAMSGYLFTQLQVAIGFVMSEQFNP